VACGAAVLSFAALVGWVGVGALACAALGGNGHEEPGAAEDRERAERLAMVETQIAARGVRDAAVLRAMRTVPRHRFVPPSEARFAYTDGPLSIGHEQTISQPYIVALMTELIRPSRTANVLEIGTGSGYQAAVLAECVAQVYTIEILESLGRRAESLLRDLGYRNVHVRVGDGYDGWPEKAPFDAILVTAAPTRIPEPLIGQLKVGGRLVLPLGEGTQDLVVVTKTERGTVREVVTAVRFVPMTGKVRNAP
jgi:protein-L-isoaspartate(D-aspartate) O-methyltransferase